MKLKHIAVAVSSALALGSLAGVAHADNNPVDEKWWPSEFGKDDQAGATNYITPAKRAAAANLVRKGQVATLGRNGLPEGTRQRGKVVFVQQPGQHRVRTLEGTHREFASMAAVGQQTAPKPGCRVI